MQNDVPVDDLARPVAQSGYMWLVHMLGLNAIILPLVALIAFAVVLVLLRRGKGPAMVGAILLVVPLPLLIGLLSAVRGIVSSASVIAIADIDIKQSELFAGIADTCAHIAIGMLLSIPAFLLASVGLIVRALEHQPAASEAPLPAKVLP